MKQPQILPKLTNDVMCLGFLVSLSLAAGLGFNNMREEPLPLEYQDAAQRLSSEVAHLKESEPQALPEPVAREELPETDRTTRLPEHLTLNQFQAHVEAGEIRVLDARPEIFHRLGHVPGAISLPRDEFENRYQDLRAELETDKAQPLIIYCSSASCEDSELVRTALSELGYTNLSVFKGGWSEWETAGLPKEENL